MVETISDSSFQEADYGSRTHLYEAQGHPGSVFRRPFNKAEIANSADRDKQFAELLIDLEERYGISSPKMSLFQTTNVHGHPRVFIEGQWVEGKNLSDNSSEIPKPVVRLATESIINYYLDATKEGGPYLADLRPSNIIYGKTEGDTADRLYFVDIEPLWGRNEPGQPVYIDDMDRVLPELWFLIQEGLRNGENWEGLSRAFAGLENLH